MLPIPEPPQKFCFLLAFSPHPHPKVLESSILLCQLPETDAGFCEAKSFYNLEAPFKKNNKLSILKITSQY